MKTFTKTIIASTLMAMSSVALAEISGNVALTTDYVFRGQSQNDQDPAIQGGLDWSNDSGFYLGVWGSAVAQGRATTEIDIYGGVAGEFSGGMGWDLGVIRYVYPEDGFSPEADFNEIYGSLSYSVSSVDLSLGLSYSDDFYGGTDSATYIDGGLSFAATKDFTISAHVGHQAIDNNASWGSPDWTDYSIGVSTEMAGLGWDLSYYDTDLSKDECFGTAAAGGGFVAGSGSEICDGRVVFTISKSM